LDDDKLDTSLLSIHSTGVVSRKSSDISFKSKFKTEKCKYWDLNKSCKYGDNCAFAHGTYEIRKKSIPTSNYKTKRCKQFFESGYCLYGSRCQFQHKEFRNSPFTYKTLLKSIQDGEGRIDSSRRLKIFEFICSEKRIKKKSVEKSIFEEKSIYEKN
jgi:hypothetical protein